MDIIYIRLIESSAVLLAYFILRLICFKIIDRTLADRLIMESRGFITKRFVNIIFLAIAVVVIMLIWGVDQTDLALFIGSILTVVGVAFFAQWSILSNVTSSLILFFNHPVRLNDDIVILEGKEYVIEGRVTHIGLFFITLQSGEGEEITLPNNIFIQKSIKKKGVQE